MSVFMLLFRNLANFGKEVVTLLYLHRNGVQIENLPFRWTNNLTFDPKQSVKIVQIVKQQQEQQQQDYKDVEARVAIARA